VLALLFIVALWILQHNVLAVAFFPAPMPEKSWGHYRSLKGTLAFPNAGKVFRSPEYDLLHSPMPENSGLLSQARLLVVRNINVLNFLAFGDAKGLLPGTRVFWHRGMWKRFMGGGKNILVLTPGLSILGNGIFWWKAKTKRLFSQCMLMLIMRVCTELLELPLIVTKH
jgi:hypothetical protein